MPDLEATVEMRTEAAALLAVVVVHGRAEQIEDANEGDQQDDAGDQLDIIDLDKDDPPPLAAAQVPAQVDPVVIETNGGNAAPVLRRVRLTIIYFYL